MDWFIDAYGDSFVVAPSADAQPQERAKQQQACTSVFTFPMNARKKGCAPLSPRGSGELEEPLLAADGTCAIYLGDRIVTDPDSLPSTSAKQQPARKQQPNRGLCWGTTSADDMVVTIIAKGASTSAAAGGKLALVPASPDIQRDTLPPTRDQAPVPSPSAAPPAPAASKSFSYSQTHPMQDPFAASSGGSSTGALQLRSFSSMQGRAGFGSGGGAPPTAHGSASCGGAAATGPSGGAPLGSSSQLHTWASTEWWRNMSSSRLNEMADAEDPRSPEMRKIPYVGGSAPMCALCHGDADADRDREAQQVAAVLQQQL